MIRNQFIPENHKVHKYIFRNLVGNLLGNLVVDDQIEQNAVKDCNIVVEVAGTYSSSHNKLLKK